jgi:hypothetical protein
MKFRNKSLERKLKVLQAIIHSLCCNSFLATSSLRKTQLQIKQQVG